MLNKQTYEILLNRYAAMEGPKPDLAEYLDSHTRQIEQIQAAVARHRRNMKHLEDEYKRNINAELSELHKVQNKCPHYSYQFYPDPAGGSDSHYECKICGQQSRSGFNRRAQ